MSLYLYALVAEAPSGELGDGLAGEPLELCACDGVLALCGRMAEPPETTAAALRAHDAVVRRLAAIAPALLPARFGEIVGDEDELADGLAARADALRAALERVRDREQMTVRLFAAADADKPASGTEYLARRRSGVAARVRAAVAPLALDERSERGRPPLACTLHHLVARGAAEDYRRALAGLALDGARLTVSGPWLPYAFAPSWSEEIA